jgi:hypothetical protein
VLPEATAIEQRITALAGLERPVYVVEHILLRPRGRELGVTLGKQVTYRARVYGVRGQLTALLPPEGLDDQLREAFEARGSDRGVELSLGQRRRLHLDPRIPDLETARRVVSAFGHRRPPDVTVSTARARVNPYRLSVVHLAPVETSREERLRHLERIVRENCPAHLEATRVMLASPEHVRRFERLYSSWACAWQPERASHLAADPPPPPSTPHEKPAPVPRLTVHDLARVDHAAECLYLFLRTPAEHAVARPDRG